MDVDTPMTERAEQARKAITLLDCATSGIAGLGRKLEAHGLAVFLARLGELPEGLAPSLPAEHRASAHLPPTSRSGFLTRRRLARSVLSRALGISAEDIVIDTNPMGQPLVRLPIDLPEYSVSFSARGDLAMIGLMRCTDRCAQLGVDVENALVEGRIPWNMLHPDERTWLSQSPDQQRIGRAVLLWTLKEATVKALGQGFRIPPEDIGIHLPEIDDVAAFRHPIRLFLRNGQTNPELETATVLTWRVQTRLKEQRFDPDFWEGGASHAALVILGQAHGQGT